MRKPQIQKVRNWLQKGHSLTPLQALRKFGSLRLSALIYTLRKSGMNITTEHFKVGTRTWVAKYRLEE